MRSRQKIFSMYGLCLLLVVFFVFPACIPVPPPAGCYTGGVITESLPEPHIVGVEVNGEKRRADSLVVGAREENLVVELKAEDADCYFFKLNAKGLSECGIAARYPQVSYSFLPGGEYLMEYWYEKNGASSVHQTLQIHVRESVFEKVWFIPALSVCIALIVAAFIFFLVVNNIQQRLKMQKIRSRIAADLHDEVSSDLSGIAISMTTLERRRSISTFDMAQYIQEIRQTLKETQHNLSDTVWAIKPDKDTSGELFQRMNKFALQMLGPNEIQVHFKNSIPVEKTLKISMERRHNVFKIFKEAVHNIYKHAGATEVGIQIGLHSEGIQIQIRDNGCGFDPAVKRDGSGISNYYWRAKENLIDFRLDTAPGQGVCITMVVPQF